MLCNHRKQIEKQAHRPGQLNLDLTLPSLSFDMLHERPRRNYNNPHLPAINTVQVIKLLSVQVIKLLLTSISYGHFYFTLV